MARAKEFKLYVDTTNGEVFQKPVALAGVPFIIKPKFYEITPEQALRLAKGESMRDVLREGMRLKLETELTKAVGPEADKATAPAADAPAAPAADAPAAPAADAPAADEAEAALEGMKTHAAVDEFAAKNGIEIPEGLTTIQAKKDHINTVLLTR